MDFSSLSNLISGLSTSGAQWYALVSAPQGSVIPPSIPNFSPTSTSGVAGQALSSGTNLLLIAALAIGAVFVIKALK